MKKFLITFFACTVSAMALGQGAFKIMGKSTSVSDLYKEDMASFYELEKKKFELIERIAQSRYLEAFWEEKAKKSGKSVAEAQADYEKKNLKVSDKEVKATIEKFKDHPSLKKLSNEEREKQIRDYLSDRGRRELSSGIVSAGIAKGDLVISYPRPKEPVYNVTVTEADHVRYGPSYDDVKPMGCKGDACSITIVEYSEFQCPFCVKVLPDVKRVMTEYKGKVRWIVRDFPLSFHDRARPAAVAAHCAGKQGKFWNMYGELFDNQRNLSDADFSKYAATIGLNKKSFDDCVKNKAEIEKIIDKNMQSGMEIGVSGTPAFFINGRRLSGALPFSEFQKVIDDELKNAKKS